jgi:hypothetical protein
MNKSSFKLIILLFVVISALQGASTAWAQVPQLFNYQGIARDAHGNPLSNQTIALKLSVLQTSDATVAEYEETQVVKTNEFGLYTLQIGNGTRITGQMKTVQWETGNKYIRVAVDPQGGSNYADAGTSQLLSVPYAIYADRAGVAATGGHDKTRAPGAVFSDASHLPADANYITRYTAENVIAKSSLYQSPLTGNIGLGTITPSALAKFHLYQIAGNQEFIRMQNVDPTAFGKFIMYNDNPGSYATFTKYGTTYPGSYSGIGSMYPYANLLAFGNNSSAAGNGNCLISTAGNAGISILKSGSSKLKFHADYNTENVGIGGNAAPVSRVHFSNTDNAVMDLRVSNTVSGHTAADGLLITENGNAASIMNKENHALSFGTNNNTRVTIVANGDVGIGTISPSATLEVKANTLPLGSKLTAGIFKSDEPATLIADGILRAEYTGANATNDNVAIVGKSQISVASEHGIGIIGQGGSNGVKGYAVNTAATGTAMGVSGEAFNNSNAIGMYAAGTDYGTPGGSKTGISSVGLNGVDSRGTDATAHSSLNNSVNYGVKASNLFWNGVSFVQTAGRGYGVYATGKQTGIYGEANVQDLGQSWTSIFGPTAPYTEAIGIFGKGLSSFNMPNGNTVGVVGEAVDPVSQNNVGVQGIALGAPGYNTGIAASVHGAATAGNFAVYATAPVSPNSWAGYFAGDVNMTNDLNVVNTISAFTATAGIKAFTIDHPLDPKNKILRHSSVESADMMNIYNGNVTTNASGKATVTLPSYFEALNKDYKYQLTVVDQNQFAQVRISKKIAGNQFEIMTDKPNVEISWQVAGVRHDAAAEKFRIIVEENKAVQSTGKYIWPQAFEDGQTQTSANDLSKYLLKSSR